MTLGSCHSCCYLTLPAGRSPLHYTPSLDDPDLAVRAAAALPGHPGGRAMGAACAGAAGGAGQLGPERANWGASPPSSLADMAGWIAETLAALLLAAPGPFLALSPPPIPPPTAAKAAMPLAAPGLSGALGAPPIFPLIAAVTALPLATPAAPTAAPATTGREAEGTSAGPAAKPPALARATRVAATMAFMLVDGVVDLSGALAMAPVCAGWCMAPLVGAVATSTCRRHFCPSALALHSSSLEGQATQGLL